MLKASKFLNPKADVVFKKIFGEHKNLLKSFLNAIMTLDAPIEDLEYLHPEQVPAIPEFKRTIVDVKCVDNKGRQFIVEMQMEWTSAFASRILYGASQAYTSQLKRGKGYHELCPVYALGLLNENFDTTEEYYHRYRLRHETNQNQFIEGLEIVLLELMKFKPKTTDEKKLAALWIRFLNEVEEYVEVPEDFKPYPELIEAMELSQEAAFNPMELEYYRTYWDSVSCEVTLLEGAYHKGLEEGREEGAYQTKLETARKVLESGLTKEITYEITGTSLD